ncbi:MULTISPECIES: cytochrome P450 [Amycolatopsis]|uniref:Cytochrome P450 n=1 Tax=Amycolatopsis tucumanensis TaxID=401106 RepID=A0ABP7JB37_9PSEU|nr:cytochrome P450 [Amycolatopsis tucumanensis]MCF6421636.1 cytochrome P450 [Amycolatopsis tucumanensis]
MLKRLTYPDGHLGWVATSYQTVRAVLADPRFSARSDLRHMPVPGAPGNGVSARAGMFNSMDPPEHTRYRRLLAGQFTVRRMRQLTGRVREIVDEHLDAIAGASGPVDLVRVWAQPIPAQVICELLGVPYADRARFQGHALDLFRLDRTPEQAAAAYSAVHEFVRDLVAAKRDAPADDLLSGLTAADLTDEELVNIGFVLLGAGLDTTANMLALGAFTLRTHPGAAEVLRAEPGRAVEELLRYHSVIPFTVRAALADIELDGERIAAGECVTVCLPEANRDPARFPDPDVLDLLRPSAGHVAFGHGVHQCLGQQLARVELQVALPALATRFPSLRLAVPAADVVVRTGSLVRGVAELPVVWATER